MQGNLQRDQITRISRGLAESTGGSLKIANRFQDFAQRGEQVRFLQEIRNELLATAQLGQIADRLQNPATQLPPSHRGHGSIQDGEKTGIANAARTHQLQICLRRGIQHHMVAGGFAAKGREMIDLSAELVFEVVNDRARCRNCLGQIGAAETVEGFYPKMLAESEACVLCQERVMVVGERMLEACKLVRLLVADEKFGRGHTRQLVQEGTRVGELHEAELASAQVSIGEPENPVV